LKVICLV